MSQTRTTLALEGDVKELTRVSEAIEVFCSSHGLPAGLAMKLTIVLDETLTNVMFHGAEEGEERRRLRIRVDLEIVDGALIVRQEDNGKAFDPLQAPEVDTSALLEDRTVGGLGIHLIRKLMDELDYARKDGSNVLTMKKHLTARNHI